MSANSENGGNKPQARMVFWWKEVQSRWRPAPFFKIPEWEFSSAAQKGTGTTFTSRPEP